MTRSLLFSALTVSLLAGCGGVETSSTSTTGAGGAATTTSSTSSTMATTTTGATSTATSGASSSSSGGIACPPACEQGFTCCGGACVNMANDILNCGVCGKTCLGDHPFCGNGVCQDPPCGGAGVCKGDEFCCGAACCPGNTLCCEVPGPGPTFGPKCTVPENGTCPLGCPLCK